MQRRIIGRKSAEAPAARERPPKAYGQADRSHLHREKLPERVTCPITSGVLLGPISADLRTAEIDAGMPKAANAARDSQATDCDDSTQQASPTPPSAVAGDAALGSNSGEEDTSRNSHAALHATAQSVRSTFAQQ